MELTKEQNEELQRRYLAAYKEKGDTLTWSDLYNIRHPYFEELRKQTSPVAVSVTVEQQPTLVDDNGKI